MNMYMHIEYMLLFLKKKKEETFEEKHSTLNPHPQNILSYFPLCGNSKAKILIQF